VVVRWRASNYSAFWGLTLDEGIHYRLGTFRPIQPVNKMTSMRVFAEDELPETFDARVEWPGLIEGVLDQGNCGSSWAFSTTGSRLNRILYDTSSCVASTCSVLFLRLSQNGWMDPMDGDPLKSYSSSIQES